MNPRFFYLLILLAVLAISCKTNNVAQQSINDKSFACAHYKTDSEYLRSVSVQHSSDAIKARKMAIGSAKEYLARQITRVLRDSKKALSSSNKADLDQKERILTHQILDNIRPTCDKLDLDKTKGIYTYKVAFELWGKDLATSFLAGLSTEDEEPFRKEFKKALDKLAKEKL